MIARISLTLLAVAVLGWLAIMGRDTQLLKRGLRGWKALPTAESVACANPRPAPGRDCSAYGRVKADLRGARFLSLDSTTELLQAVLESGARWRVRATAIERVLRREPDNLVAWKLLLYATRGHEAATADHALAELHRLDPINWPSG